MARESRTSISSRRCTCCAQCAAGLTSAARRASNRSRSRLSSRRRRMPRCSRVPRRSHALSHSPASGTTNSAAAEGVGARTSAAKSAIVKSISWPMPLTTGIGEATIARANRSSLKAHRSSREPPPRARISTSHSARRPARPTAAMRLRGRLRTLHGNGVDQNRHGGEAPRQYMQDVADRRSGGRSDHPDTARKRRQRAFAFGCEQSFRGQFGAQFLELPLQGAEACILHVVDDELVFAARLIQSDTRPYQHLLAVARGEGAQHVSLPKHAAAHLRPGVFQRKIPMSGTRLREIGNLRLEPQAAETALEQRPHLAIEARNGVDVALGTREGTGDLGALHAQMIAVYRAASARYNAPPL